LCGSEDFEKKVRLEEFDPLENLKPLYDEEGGFFGGF
jgi:hypothetical protein